MGSKKRRWQLQDCVDAAEAAAIAASLARLDGRGRWRVYDMVTVPGRAGSLVLVRRNVVAEGVVRLEVRRAGGTGSAGVDSRLRSAQPGGSPLGPASVCRVGAGPPHPSATASVVRSPPRRVAWSASAGAVEAGRAGRPRSRRRPDGRAAGPGEVRSGRPRGVVASDDAASGLPARRGRVLPVVGNTLTEEPGFPHNLQLASYARRRPRSASATPSPAIAPAIAAPMARRASATGEPTART